MEATRLFEFANSLALIGWALLIFTPRWRYTRILVSYKIFPLLFALLYAVLAILFFGQSEGGFSSITDVRAMFSNDYVLLAGWLHYLAFDLFVGGWIIEDAQVRLIRHWLVIPCLLFTFMLGPVGFLVYSVIRSYRWSKGPTPSDS